jgi:hypothetical protein
LGGAAALPSGECEAITYADVQDEVTRWLVVDLGMVVFIPLIAGAVYLLVRGRESTAARVCRIALMFFLVFYGAFEVLVGVGTGTLVDDINGLAASERAAAPLVEGFNDNILIRGPVGVFTSLGSLAFITAAIAAGVALRREAGTPRCRAPARTIGFSLRTRGTGLFMAAVLLLVRSQAVARAPARLTQPGPA